MDNKGVNSEFTTNPTAQLVYINIRDLQNIMKLGFDGEMHFRTLMASLPSSVKNFSKDGGKTVGQEFIESLNDKDEKIKIINLKKYPKWCGLNRINRDASIEIKQAKYEMYIYMMNIIIDSLDEVYHITENRSHINTS